MDSGWAAVESVRALLDLPTESGERFSEEWKIVRRRIDIVHGVTLPRETEPAGAPRLATDRG
jgi:hypothetical protein